MTRPLRSNYTATRSGPRAKDTEANLAHGSLVITTTLTRQLEQDETDLLLVGDAGAATVRGTAIVDDEIIYYHVYHRSEPGTLSDLLRGQQGTAAAVHAVGAPVTIVSQGRFNNPALSESIISMQEDILDLLARVEILERRP